MNSLVDVAGDDLAVGRQSQGHGQRTIAGEDADLDGAARAQQLHQQRHELALLRRDLKARRGMARGLLAQAASTGGFAKGDREQVIGNRIGRKTIRGP